MCGPRDCCGDHHGLFLVFRTNTFDPALVILRHRVFFSCAFASGKAPWVERGGYQRTGVFVALMDAAMRIKIYRGGGKRTSHPDMSRIWLSCVVLLGTAGLLASTPEDGGGRQSFVWISPDRTTADGGMARARHGVSYQNVRRSVLGKRRHRRDVNVLRRCSRQHRMEPTDSYVGARRHACLQDFATPLR